MVDFPVIPSKTALINVDMQNCFVENSPIAAPGGLEVLERINKLAAACRKAGVKVIHTAHVVRPDHSNVGVLGEIVPPVNDGVITKGNFTAEIHGGVEQGPDDMVLDKPRFGSFHGTDLDVILRSSGIDTIIVTGIATNICCETTAREANVRDYHVFFISDGTATFGIGDVSAEEIQKVTCATLGFAFAQVETVDDMIGKIEAAAAVPQAAE